MTGQKDLTTVIDEFAAAIAVLAHRAPPAAFQRLTKATGDLLEAFASSATNLAAGAASTVLLKLERIEADAEVENERIGAIERRSDTRGAQMNDMQIDLDQQAERINTLEEQNET